MQRFFIEDQSMVENMLLSLKPVALGAVADDLLLDESTGQQWRKYQTVHDIDDPLVTGIWAYPYLPVIKIIAVVVTTPHLDEVSSAITLLNHLEWVEEQEYRELLLDSIEAAIDSVDLVRFDIIYERAEFWSNDNRREIIGKHYQEVKEDAAYFAQLALRAGAIRTRIQRRG